MPKIKAFKGIRYNTATVGIASVICPPYDVIKASQVDAYYNKSPYNSIRLVLGQQFPKDTKTDNRYTRAKEFYHGWKSKGVLIQDEKPSIYYHEQTYTMGDKTCTRKGIIAAVKMDENDSYEIMPHEYTHKSTKIDRLRLMMDVKANLSCVLGIYSDKNKLLDTEIKPLLKDILWDLTLSLIHISEPTRPY